MTDQTPDHAPQSPEVQSADVREALQQAGVSHEGLEQPVRDAAPSAHLGANELDVSPIVAPMRGPGNLLGPEAGGDGRDDADDAGIDPVDEITPG